MESKKTGASLIKMHDTKEWKLMYCVPEGVLFGKIWKFNPAKIRSKDPECIERLNFIESLHHAQVEGYYIYVTVERCVGMGLSDLYNLSDIARLMADYLFRQEIAPAHPKKYAYYLL